MPRFTLFILASGNHAPLFFRCINSVLRFTPRDRVRIFVALSAACDESRNYAKELLEHGAIDLVLDSERNGAKELCYTLLMRHVETEFVIRIDDDTHFLAPWLDELEREIAYDVDGIVGEWGRVVHFAPVKFGATEQGALGADDVKAMPWFRGKSMRGAGCASGGFVCSRTKALREIGYCFPDAPPSWMEDNWTGEALHQTDWAIRDIPLAWSDKLKLGDEIGCGSRTDRAKPREVWDGTMDGITITEGA